MPTVMIYSSISVAIHFKFVDRTDVYIGLSEIVTRLYPVVNEVLLLRHSNSVTKSIFSKRQLIDLHIFSFILFDNNLSLKRYIQHSKIIVT